MFMRPRRAQTPIMVRSDKAAEILSRWVGPGRSQAVVIEDALQQLEADERASGNLSDVRQEFAYQPPFQTEAQKKLFRELMEISERGKRTKRKYASMAEFDAHEYDERGNPR